MFAGSSGARNNDAARWGYSRSYRVWGPRWAERRERLQVPDGALSGVEVLGARRVVERGGG
ncbi:hypothetical protein [Sorangium sp. So ce394]|uniref:hypothetical protein n=1 Tax=Sorangium sp. So ce394 TaxID=3133310 RepID=UPI003F5B5ECA